MHVLFKNMNNNSKTCSKGFTLIEILVSLAILGIAFVAILKSTILVQGSLISTKKENQAAMLGAKKMAEIVKDGPDNINQWDGTFEKNPNLKWRIEDQPTSKDRLKKIKLIISGLNQQKEILTFERIIYKSPSQ